MDRIGDIALFLRVLDTGSISAAARSLDLSPALASQRLKRLEDALGVRLLHRTTRRLHPTPEGLRLAGEGRALVEALDGLAGSLRESGGQAVGGTLRVTMSASFGRLHISPRLPRFLAAHPGLQVSVHMSDQQVDLVREGFDLAIRIGDLDDSQLVGRRIARNPRVLVASPAYLARHGAPAAPIDLTAHDCLVLVGSRGRQDRWQLLDGAGGDSTVTVSGALDSNLGEVLRDAALADAGIALLALWHVVDDLHAGRLVRVLPTWAPPVTAIHAVMPDRMFVPQRTRAFVAFLQTELGSHLYGVSSEAPR
ncbi:LysR family transcriptional regulator [Luteimonas sp. 3794]|uniref:LysR family transcriptional regulator n=1 Tax=Luteimonas sp. 3794 TaxID=2817730 RepID=UPI0028622E30|nr:LysR family transcriptional regulator [Luteimonas sp. 3794]MDR6991399.1 DNA-binding transcriptional LysR family regulator [Luteimonas sp. 3794]